MEEFLPQLFGWLFAYFLTGAAVLFVIHFMAKKKGDKLLAEDSSGAFEWLIFWPVLIPLLFIDSGGPVSNEAPDPAVPAEPPLGQRGTALRDLRPSGMIEIGGKRFDALTEHAPIRKGDQVEVIGGNRMRLIVRKAERAPT